MTTSARLQALLDGEPSTPGDRGVLVEISAWQARLAALQTNILLNEPDPPATTDRYLTITEVAARLNMSKQWVYTNWQTRMPFGIKTGHKSVRFSERKFNRWLEMREAA